MREGDDEMGFYLFFFLSFLFTLALFFLTVDGVEVELHIANLAIQCCFVL